MEKNSVQHSIRKAMKIGTPLKLRASHGKQQHQQKKHNYDAMLEMSQVTVSQLVTPQVQTNAQSIQ